MSITVRISLAIGLLISLGVADAAAQSEGRVAVGANLTLGRSDDSKLRGVPGLGLLWRLGQGEDGWGLKYAVPWYSTQLDEEVAGTAHALGTLKVRPIMVGYGYSRQFGRARFSANLLGGYSLNSLSVAPAFEDAYRARLGADRARVHVSDSLVLRPELTAWIDLTRTVGLNVTAGYSMTRPTITVTSAAGREVRRVRADMFSVKIGAVYSLF